MLGWGFIGLVGPEGGERSLQPVGVGREVGHHERCHRYGGCGGCGVGRGQHLGCIANGVAERGRCKPRVSGQGVQQVLGQISVASSDLATQQCCVFFFVFFWSDVEAHDGTGCNDPDDISAGAVAGAIVK